MFRFTKKPSSGRHSQCLAKITRLVQCCYRRRAEVVGAMAAQYDLCGVCCVLCKRTRLHSAQHTPHSSYYAAIAPTTSARRLYQH
jgi:hypothetical protein